MKNRMALLCYALLVVAFISGIIGWKLMKQQDCQSTGHSNVYCMLRR